MNDNETERWLSALAAIDPLADSFARIVGLVLGAHFPVISSLKPDNLPEQIWLQR